MTATYTRQWLNSNIHAPSFQTFVSPRRSPSQSSILLSAETQVATHITVLFIYRRRPFSSSVNILINFLKHVNLVDIKLLIVVVDGACRMLGISYVVCVVIEICIRIEACCLGKIQVDLEDLIEHGFIRLSLRSGDVVQRGKSIKVKKLGLQ